ncbi:hypothetical protein DES40_1900 [Litorimonas taeanensis]|uniref:Uncharacterized protein n=1 Tax=Litorimonas taeanensis TaxID=568099 RepID=A0A420WDR3_9PROT|nr:hypothetical protein DES40_1900 [Litorimonas taeanensis]
MPAPWKLVCEHNLSLGMVRVMNGAILLLSTRLFSKCVRLPHLM